MTSRRSFLKRLVATAVTATTVTRLAAEGVWGVTVPEEEVREALRFNPANYRGEYHWININNITS